ncbi:MAG: hypothetical protein KAW12_13435 [Candidatus Aminicenantes bacterium]|nr:hypothetical protein [Candidatus Aminicenantes bacterium]
MEHSELLLEVAAKIRLMQEFKGAQVQIVDNIWEASDSAGFPMLAVMDGGDAAQPIKYEEMMQYNITMAVIQKKMTGTPVDSVVGTEASPGAMKLKERVVAFLKLKENRIEPFYTVKYMGSPPKNPFDRLVIGGSDVSWKLSRMQYRKKQTILN